MARPFATCCISASLPASLVSLFSSCLSLIRCFVDRAGAALCLRHRAPRNSKRVGRKTMSNEYWAELSGVKKRFGKTVALGGLDLQVRPGELFSVLGPNGAGKSTAVSLMLGLLRPEAGEARLFGQSPLLV